MSIKHALKQELCKVISENTGLEQEQVSQLMEKPKNRQFGDLAFPCFPLAKLWKTAPPACAEKLRDSLPLPQGISKAAAAGPFLNFSFDRQYYIREVITAALADHPLPKTNKTVVVEYSSPNIAKPFHVGHLRATLIGNCLDRLYRHLGWNTISVNHLGDWGTQFGFVWAGCKLWGFPEKRSVQSLVQLYRQATGLKEEQEKEDQESTDKNKETSEHPNINEMARGYFVDLEKGEKYAVDFWEECVAVSLEYLKATYKRLGVSFDHYTGESFYSDKLEEVRAMLESSKLLTESQGALGVDLGEKLGFARIFTPDGRSLYLTRDLAAAKYRAETFDFDKAVYVVGAPQSLHFQQIKGVLKQLGAAYSEKIKHVAFGHVLGMKTRGAGSVIELNDFLDEAYERSLDAYHNQVSRRPEGLDETGVARGVALAAIIFSNLSRGNIKDVNFSWKHALEFQGDTGPYLLYACARINGIQDKAAQAGITLDGPLDFKQLSEDSAYQLVSVLSDFEETLQKTLEDDEPSYLCSYSLDLAKAFSKAYQDLQVIGEEECTARTRLALFESTRLHLSRALSLLGISPLERM